MLCFSSKLNVMGAKNPIVLHYDLSSVRMVMLGAAPLGKDLEDELQDLWHCKDTIPS
jgi:hypothetical protein